MREPILILGAARSGTSLTAGIFHACGAFGGEMRGPTSHNARGFFENTRIVNGLVKPYLKSIGADPKCQKPLPRSEWLRPWPSLRSDVLGVFRSEGLRPDQSWFYKGAKVCFLWPLWLEAFPGTKWVVVRRKAEDIAASCLRTSFMSAFYTAEGWLGWVREHEKRFEEIKSTVSPVREVWSDRIVAGDFAEIREAVVWAGLAWNEEAVRGFVAPELWNRDRRVVIHAQGGRERSAGDPGRDLVGRGGRHAVSYGGQLVGDAATGV